MQRGEVWWANFPKPVGQRPVVLVSRNRAIQVRRFVTVVEVTTTIREIPVEVPLGPEDGLPKRCVANCDVLNTVPKAILIQRVCILSPAKLHAVNATLRFALDLESLLPELSGS